MVVKRPASIDAFCALFQTNMTVWQRQVVPRLIISLLMSCGKPNYATMARTVLSAGRNRSSLSRFFNTRRFNPDQLHLAALTAVQASRSEQNRGVWFLILDGTATRCGGFSKIDNATKYREKTAQKKGGYPSTKAHMFLMGILLLPDGTRLPLPVLPYYTKDYCRKNKIVFKTQVELAAQMIRSAPIPATVEKVVVLGDEYYEGETIHKTCSDLGYSYIMPTDSRRCFADQQGNSTAVTLHGRGRRLARDSYQKIILVEGQETTAPYRRLSEPGRKTKRVYRASGEDRSVRGLGQVRVVYSWKRKKQRRNQSSGDTFKVLVSNDPTITVKQIVEYYELRWQIELFFRELKSIIGFQRFKGQSFRAYARFVSITLLSFLYLEWLRGISLAKTKSRKEKSTLARNRTTGLLHLLRAEIDMENVSHIAGYLDGKNPRAEIETLFRKIIQAAA